VKQRDLAEAADGQVERKTQADFVRRGFPPVRLTTGRCDAPGSFDRPKQEILYQLNHAPAIRLF
jgi:hypothetical protein